MSNPRYAWIREYIGISPGWSDNARVPCHSRVNFMIAGKLRRDLESPSFTSSPLTRLASSELEYKGSTYAPSNSITDVHLIR